MSIGITAIDDSGYSLDLTGSGAKRNSGQVVTGASDTVSISAEALRKLQDRESGSAVAESAGESIVERLEDQIEELQKEIQELQESDLPEKEKQSQIQAKQAQIIQLEQQLEQYQSEGLKAAGTSSGGGTRAMGFSNSLT